MTTPYGARLLALVGLAAVAAGPVAAQDLPALETYSIDPARISVSGMSSGGYMAVQLHVAFSARFMGVGVVAAGPYWCAEGNVLRATSICMNALPVPPSAETLVSVTETITGNGVDDPANMADDRVYLFTGRQDDVVRRPVMAALREYYEAFVNPDNIVFVDTVEAPHAFITDDDGAQACFQRCTPLLDECTPNDCAPNDLCTFVNDCDYDTAGAILEHLHGPLQQPTDAVADNLLTFDQAEFVEDNDPGRYSLADDGHVYVPSVCRSGDTPCALHVALHGCLQGSERIGDAFYAGAGYNEWAEANAVVVLYPQAVASELVPFNPRGCWDWWGYSGVFYYRQQGPQMAAIAAMIDRVAGAAVAEQ